MRPCDNCPFRRNVRPYLRPERVAEIAGDGTFPCHKTREHNDEGELIATESSVECAGKLIMRELMGQPSQAMRIAERLGIYKRERLDMKAPVYANVAKMEMAYRVEWNRERGKT